MAKTDLYEDFDPMAQFTDTVAGDVRDPYPDFHDKRRDVPVERREEPTPDGGTWVAYEVYRHDDVVHVLRDNRTFSSEAIRDLMGVVFGPYPLVGMDEPEHKRLRSLVAQPFRSKTLERWEQELMVVVVDELIDRFADRGHAELVREFTFQFPVQVIATILGLSRDDYPRFHEWAVDVISVSANPERGIAAADALRGYFAEVLEQRRSDPRDDLISDLTRAELDGERLGDEEIFSFLRLLLPAGAETTYRASGNFLFGLLTHPDQLAALLADDSLMPQAVEESIRWESPLLITSRSALVDTEVAGVKIPAGAEVVPNVGSANHDPSVWDRPDEFDIFRDSHPLVAFGTGVHMCLGMHLARMEMKVAVRRLFERLPNLRLDPEAMERDDPHIHGQAFRSPTSLPVLFG